MMKKNVFIILAIFAIAVKAENVKMPIIALKDIQFKVIVNANEEPNESQKIYAIFQKDTLVFNGKKMESFIEYNLTLNKIGRWEIISSNNLFAKKDVRIIPAWLSILPPLIAISLALIIKEIVVSLLLGIFVGAFFIYDYNFFLAFLRTIDSIIPEVLLDSSHIMIILFSMLIGGMIGIISKNGGMEGLASLISRKIKTRKGALLGTFGMGIAIFFDDYSNSLIVGNLARPLADKYKISREKLAFIVDSTSAPIASVAIIGTWIGYEVGIIQDSLKAIGYDKNAYLVFIDSLAYRFYPFCMLFFIAASIFLKRDMFSMYKAEIRAIETGELYRPGAAVIRDLTNDVTLSEKQTKPNWTNAALPLIFLIGASIAGLAYTGYQNLKCKNPDNLSIKEIIAASDPFVSLLWASFASCVFAALVSVISRSLKFKETIDAWFLGIRSMLYAMLILTLAWSIGGITQEIKTADFLVSILSEAINPYLIPPFIFIICAAISFSTGTSWGTLSIAMPLAIPLSYNAALNSGLNPFLIDSLLLNSIASVLAGSIWGDHCSPIADTTVLSAMASSCDLIDHVNTQLPYAIFVGLISLIFGTFLSSFFDYPLFFLAISFVILYLSIFIFGKKYTSW